MPPKTRRGTDTLDLIPSAAPMKGTSEVVRVKEAFAWIEEQRTIHLKAVTPKGEAVSLTAAEVRTLAQRLEKLATILESLQARGDEPG